ncbi:hypothetical protein C8R48DRAFT_675013 [Suillus tomentosus]|nr:hypothetical protein C8R48DRAFT_675013 [Suillus tomentosus]
MSCQLATTEVDVYATENQMFTHQPGGRTYHQALFYPAGYSEAILTYVPQDADGFLRAHMWIAGGHLSASTILIPSLLVFHGFPDCLWSTFPHAYGVVYLQQHSSLPKNQAIARCHAVGSSVRWFGDVLVVKHVGHNLQTYQSMQYEDKALLDAILSRQDLPFLRLWLGD